MVGEVFAGLSAIKTALDIAKGLEDIRDTAARNRAVIELQKEIVAAYTAQSTALERIRELEKEVADFETWEAEKEKYELKHIGWGAFVYMLKPDARGTKPAHWVCTNCYSKKQISIIQYMHAKGSGPGFACPACRTEIRHSGEAVEHGRMKWLD